SILNPALRLSLEWPINRYFPEFTVVGLVDGEQHMYYDSNIKRLVPRTDWMEKITAEDPEYWNRESEKAQGSQETFKASIDILMKRFNQTQGVHTVQVMYGCELDDDGTKRGYRQEGYDGEDFLSLDMNTLTWTAANPKAVITKLKLDGLNAGGYHKFYLENTCIEWLQKYVDYGRSTLERKVPPEISLFQKDSSSPVVCHATGFFPEAVKISWKKNGEDLYEGFELRETVPNQDGTFQRRSILTVSPEGLKNNEYTCVIQHSSLEKEIRLSDPTVLTAASQPYITKRSAERGMQRCKAPPLDSRAVEACSLEGPNHASPSGNLMDESGFGGCQENGGSELCSPLFSLPCTPQTSSTGRTCHLQTFSDDSVVVGCIRDGQDGEYRDLVNSFVEWSARSQLLLNMTKTKEMVVDLEKELGVVVARQQCNRIDLPRLFLVDCPLCLRAPEVPNGHGSQCTGLHWLAHHSDSGLYYCCVQKENYLSFSSTTYLQIRVKTVISEAGCTYNVLPMLVLGGVIVVLLSDLLFLLFIILKYRKHHRAASHSLQYFYTAVTPGIDFPEFTVVGLVDGEQIVYYDSNIKRLVPKTDWMEKNADDPDYWNRESEKAQGSQEIFKANIDILMERFNQTRGLHTVQVTYGCELDDDGTKRGYRQEGYDGEDFISLDLNTLTWTAANAKAVITKLKLERINAGGYHKTYLENTCIEWLEKYVGYSRSTLERKVPPESSLFQKDSSSPLVCHATGFYPKPVSITWKKNGEDLDEGVELRETLPNQDGTFQRRSILTVPPEELNKHTYTCIIQHSSLEIDLWLSGPTVLT
ncbi:hypothetical protein NFI96_021894, partial [Prochilodus magdalenae]